MMLIDTSTYLKYSMNILQAGVSKSGNYWLYSILHNILLEAGQKHRSYIQQHPIQSETGKWQLSFAGQSEMDFLSIEGGKCYCRISQVFKEEIADIDSYISSCSQVWTHSTIDAAASKILAKFDKIVYIIRDPRDRAISKSKYDFTEHKLTNGIPHYEKDPQSYLENRLPAMTRYWVRHVGGYLKYRTELNIYPVFYERWLHDFDRELVKLLAYLEIELSPQAIARIKHNVSFKVMKQKSPKHLRKGSSGQWQDVLSDRQKQEVEQIAGSMLELLNYPPASQDLPQFEELSTVAIDRAIAKVKSDSPGRIVSLINFLNSNRSVTAKLNLALVWSSGTIKRLVRIPARRSS